MSGRVFEVKSAQSSQTPELKNLFGYEEQSKNRHQW